MFPFLELMRFTRAGIRIAFAVVIGAAMITGTCISTISRDDATQMSGTGNEDVLPAFITSSITPARGARALRRYDTIWSVQEWGARAGGIWRQDQSIYTMGYHFTTVRTEHRKENYELINGTQVLVSITMWYTFTYPVDSLVLAKWTLDGNCSWKKAWPAKSKDHGGVMWSDGNWIYGCTSIQPSDYKYAIYLVKWDMEGNMAWNKTWTCSNANYNYVYAKGICGTNGDVYTVASTGDTYYGSPTQDQVYLIKWDANGNVVWNRTWNAGLSATNEALVASNHSIYLSGNMDLNGKNQYFTRWNLSGDLIVNRTWNSGASSPGSMMISDGSFLYHYENALNESRLSKMNLYGDVVWNRSILTSGNTLNMATNGTCLFVASNQGGFNLKIYYMEGTFLNSSTITSLSSPVSIASGDSSLYAVTGTGSMYWDSYPFRLARIDADWVPYAEFNCSGNVSLWEYGGYVFLTGDAITFHMVGDDGDMPASFYWRFGDGTSSTEREPVHVYRDHVNDYATLRVTDANGDVSDYSTYVHTYVREQAEVRADFRANQSYAIQGRRISFTVTGKSGSYTGSRYWHFGDGIIEHAGYSNPIEHCFTSAGTYVVTLNYSTVCNLSSVKSQSLRVLAPDADDDGDGLTNVWEHDRGLDPLSSDSDNDGFNDGVETSANTNPKSWIDNTASRIVAWASLGAVAILIVVGVVKNKKKNASTSGATASSVWSSGPNPVVTPLMPSVPITGNAPAVVLDPYEDAEYSPGTFPPATQYQGAFVPVLIKVLEKKKDFNEIASIDDREFVTPRYDYRLTPKVARTYVEISNWNVYNIFKGSDDDARADEAGGG